MGLAIDSSDEALSPSHEQNATGSIPHPPSIKPMIGKEQAVFPPRRNRRSHSHCRLKYPSPGLAASSKRSQRSTRDICTSPTSDAGFDRVGLSLLNQNDSDRLSEDWCLCESSSTLPPFPIRPTQPEHQFFLRFSSESIHLFLTFQTRWAGL